MNKQLNKIDELITWLEQNAPEDACVILLAMSENQESDPAAAERKLDVKTYIDGYDQAISEMLVKKMILIPLLKQVFVEALFQVDVKIDTEDFLKWREKNKYDNKFEPLDLEAPAEEGEEEEGGEAKEAPQPEEYIRRIQEFCVWMNEKPSRNLTLILLAQDELDSEKTTFAMGFAPDISSLVGNEMKENYGLRVIVEGAIMAVEAKASYPEFLEWKKTLKK